ncbi:MAG: hypothetical protein L0Y68_01805 [Candidatus Dadabacteria bacterium]|nr:hypothetical protein [Candidatus Dadabacteria bacterium]
MRKKRDGFLSLFFMPFLVLILFSIESYSQTVGEDPYASKGITLFGETGARSSNFVTTNTAYTSPVYVNSPYYYPSPFFYPAFLFAPFYYNPFFFSFGFSYYSNPFFFSFGYPFFFNCPFIFSPFAYNPFFFSPRRYYKYPYSYRNPYRNKSKMIKTGLPILREPGIKRVDRKRGTEKNLRTRLPFNSYGTVIKPGNNNGSRHFRSNSPFIKNLPGRIGTSNFSNRYKGGSFKGMGRTSTGRMGGSSRGFGRR